jgi:chemotaxis protein MotB
VAAIGNARGRGWRSPAAPLWSRAAPDDNPIGMKPTTAARLAALALSFAPGVATAQEPPPTEAGSPAFEDVQATIRRMQERLDRLGSSAAERDQALQFLERQVEAATGEIAGNGKTAESLRGETAVLSDKLQDVSRARDQLEGEAGERGAALAALESRVEELSGELGRAGAARAELATELEAVRASLAASTAREGELQGKLAGLESAARGGATALAERTAEADRLRERVAALERTAGEDAKVAAARLAGAEAEADRLRREVAVLKQEVGQLNGLLAAAETKVDEQQDRIDGLDERLAAALATRVEELERYRSEFFGRLRAALGDRPDLRVVGDRFVFQSELLFDSGSARLDPAGQAQLRQLARTLEDVAARIPPGLDWVLRVDGHTDRQPVRDGAFRSNWELSVARAISVIDFLVAQGIPPEHLAAAGFGEYRPIDPADDEVAYRRNRRIEFKLTEG